MILKKINITDSSVSNDAQDPTVSLTVDLEFSVNNDRNLEGTSDEPDPTTLKDMVAQAVTEQLQNLSVNDM